MSPATMPRRNPLAAPAGGSRLAFVSTREGAAKREEQREEQRRREAAIRWNRDHPLHGQYCEVCS